MGILVSHSAKNEANASHDAVGIIRKDSALSPTCVSLLWQQFSQDSNGSIHYLNELSMSIHMQNSWRWKYYF
jgi:hypothetical protein